MLLQDTIPQLTLGLDVAVLDIPRKYSLTGMHAYKGIVIQIVSSICKCVI